MTPVGGGEYASPTTPQNGAGNGSTDNMSNFYNEVRSSRLTSRIIRLNATRYTPEVC